jgi:hypothetical protein
MVGTSKVGGWVAVAKKKWQCQNVAVSKSGSGKKVAVAKKWQWQSVAINKHSGNGIVSETAVSKNGNMTVAVSKKKKKKNGSVKNGSGSVKKWQWQCHKSGSVNSGTHALRP